MLFTSSKMKMYLPTLKYSKTIFHVKCTIKISLQCICKNKCDFLFKIYAKIYNLKKVNITIAIHES